MAIYKTEYERKQEEERQRVREILMNRVSEIEKSEKEKVEIETRVKIVENNNSNNTGFGAIIVILLVIGGIWGLFHMVNVQRDTSNTENAIQGHWDDGNTSLYISSGFIDMVDDNTNKLLLLDYTVTSSDDTSVKVEETRDGDIKVPATFSFPTGDKNTMKVSDITGEYTFNYVDDKTQP